MQAPKLPAADPHSLAIIRETHQNPATMEILGRKNGSHFSSSCHTSPKKLYKWHLKIWESSSRKGDFHRTWKPWIFVRAGTRTWTFGGCCNFCLTNESDHKRKESHPGNPYNDWSWKSLQNLQRLLKWRCLKPCAPSFFEEDEWWWKTPPWGATEEAMSLAFTAKTNGVLFEKSTKRHK